MHGSWRKSPQTTDLFDRPLLDYAHNFLTLPGWRDNWSLLSNPLALTLLGRLKPYAKDHSGAATLQRYVQRSAIRAISNPSEPLTTNLQRLRALMSLDDVDIALLQLALALSDSDALRNLATGGSGSVTSTSLARIVGAVLGHQPAAIARAVGRKGRLVGCGLMDLVSRGDIDDRLIPKEGLLDLLAAPDMTRTALLERFLPNIADGDAPWLDHRHLDNEIVIARSLLSGALKHGAKGINLLLYGETGTGKTELAKSLARDLGVPLYAARGDGDDGMTTPSQRVSSLMLGLRIVEAGGAMVLFDELEDLMELSLASLVLGQAGMVTSKDSFNRLLEDNAAPVIWTTNHVRTVDRAFLRRFTHAIEVRPGGIRQRARVLKQHLGLAIDQPHARLDAMAERYNVSPAQVTASIRAARLVGDPADHLAPLLEGSCRLVTGRQTRPIVNEPDAYLVDAINASIDLEWLADRLAAWKPTSGPGVTMCLYGPPGTGKSEYVRYLARRLGRAVLIKRASDIFDCWVGATERNIAAAFEEASADDAMLVFDEVDSLLQDRRDAGRSWEVTQVNEMLQQLETYQGIVACTTNRWDGLDPAVLRRFAFKIELRPPTTDQAVRLFWAMFESVLQDSKHRDQAFVRDSIARLRPTQGDISAVRRRLLALAAPRSASELLDELREETTQRARLAGFARAT